MALFTPKKPTSLILSKRLNDVRYLRLISFIWYQYFGHLNSVFHHHINALKVVITNI